jgi:hypothetical protein
MTFFAFEADFVDALRCIPMMVRYNLDRCGVKLKLHHWHQFSLTERQHLTHQPCQTPAEILAYRQILRDLVWQYNQGYPADLPIPEPFPWDLPTIPEEVQHQAQSVSITITPHQWQALTSLQKFALLKLSRSNHENNNFLPACGEFGLI